MPDPMDLVVLALRDKSAVCKRVGTGEEVTLRASGFNRAVPAEIMRLVPDRDWRYGGKSFITGRIDSIWLDATALGLTPLKLNDFGFWDPSEEYWGEEGDLIEEWAKPIIDRGRRSIYEMEQVYLDEDPRDPDADPIGIAVDLMQQGDRGAARRQLMNLLEKDLRCLDAHAHLGNLGFERTPERAVRHYEAGVRIGELSLGDEFDGVLSWGLIDNRPFLRCLHGYGLCLWRLGRFREAEAVFERMLWMNPSDNQGIHLLLPEVHDGVAWEGTDAR